VLLRAPRGAGRHTAVALWARRLVRDGAVVVWVDVPESDAVDGDALGSAVRARLAHVTGEVAARSMTPEDLAAALDAHDVMLVVDRLGPTSDAALAYLDRVARLLRRSRIVALTAMPLPGPVPTFDGWAPERRVVGTCRHFTTLACAFLRARGIPARARCGFGTCFVEGRGFDHWITEYWDADEQRWVRVDTEHLGKDYVDHLDYLAPGEFLTGGKAWGRPRSAPTQSAISPHSAIARCCPGTSGAG